MYTYIDIDIYTVRAHKYILYIQSIISLTPSGLLWAGERHRLVRGGIETYGCRSPPQAPKRGKGCLASDLEHVEY